MAASTAVASVGYRAVGEDGITVSPQVRAHFDEPNRQQLHLARIK